MPTNDIAPCPVCASLSVSATFSNQGRECLECGFALDRAAFDSLSHAAELARAVERLDTLAELHGDREPVSQFWALWGLRIDPVSRPTLAAALIALAREVRDA